MTVDIPRLVIHIRAASPVARLGSGGTISLDQSEATPVTLKRSELYHSSSNS